MRIQLEPAEQKVYAQLFEKYDGKKVTDDTHEFLENYERIVRLIGKSFPNTGIEILLHNLADPAHSLITLENNVIADTEESFRHHFRRIAGISPGRYRRSFSQLPVTLGIGRTADYTDSRIGLFLVFLQRSPSLLVDAEYFDLSGQSVVKF